MFSELGGSIVYILHLKVSQRRLYMVSEPYKCGMIMDAFLLFYFFVTNCGLFNLS